MPCCKRVKSASKKIKYKDLENLLNQYQSGNLLNQHQSGNLLNQHQSGNIRQPANLLQSAPSFDPPLGPDGQWDPQFCNLWGWTWVKKGDTNAVSNKNKALSTQTCTPRGTSAQSPNFQPCQQKSSEKNKSLSSQTVTSKGLCDPSKGLCDQPHFNRPSSPQSRKSSGKKKRGCCSCFKKRKSRKAQTTTIQQSKPAYVPPCPARNECRLSSPSQQSKNKRVVNSQQRMSPRDENHLCNCCRCGDVINLNECPCGHVCHCMHQSEETTDTESYVSKQKSLRCMETQTSCPRKDKATKTKSLEGLTPKSNNPCPCMNCYCVKTVCCPCVQHSPCQCTQKNKSHNRNVHINTNKKGMDRAVSDKLISYWLTSNTQKSNLNDFFKFKSPEFSALHKSLDILLKNNTNTMNFIKENKRLKKEDKTPNFLDLNQKISYLSFDNNVKKSGDEHSKILTAVCDAILSCHKFENDELNVLKYVSSTSMEKASQNSSNIFRSTGLIDRILNNLHFPYLNHKSRSTDECTLHKEVGVQVNSISKKRSDKSVGTTRLFGRIPKSRSRILTAPRILKKSDALRTTEMRPNFYNEIKDDRNNVLLKENENASNKLFLPVTLPSQTVDPATTCRASSSPQLCTIEQLLASVDINLTHNLQNATCSSSVHDDMNTLIQDGQSNNMYDTSPLFTDYDLSFYNENNTQERFKNGKVHFT